MSETTTVTRADYVRHLIHEHPGWNDRTVADYATRHNVSVHRKYVSNVRWRINKEIRDKTAKLDSEATKTETPLAVADASAKLLNDLLIANQCAKTVGGASRLRMLADFLVTLQG